MQINRIFKLSWIRPIKPDQPQKTIGILTKVFYTYGPNLVILAWSGDELSRGQASDYRTHGRTHRQTQPTTIPEGLNWPRVKSGYPYEGWHYKWKSKLPWLDVRMYVLFFCNSEFYCWVQNWRRWLNHCLSLNILSYVIFSAFLLVCHQTCVTRLFSVLVHRWVGGKAPLHINAWYEEISCVTWEQGHISQKMYVFRK